MQFFFHLPMYDDKDDRFNCVSSENFEANLAIKPNFRLLPFLLLSLFIIIISPQNNEIFSDRLPILPFPQKMLTIFSSSYVLFSFSVTKRYRRWFVRFRGSGRNGRRRWRRRRRVFGTDVILP